MKNKTADKGHRKRQIATWIITVVMIGSFLLSILTVLLNKHYTNRFSVANEAFDGSLGNDRIHFLDTGNSDCILIESNGHYALIDSGEGIDNPRRKAPYKGFEDEVIRYIKKVVPKTEGHYKLDFILATHDHYDHIGNFEAIVDDPEIQIGCAYFKKYNSAIAHHFEEYGWENKSTYERIIGALSDRKIKVVSDIPSTPFSFGDFTVRFVNTVTPAELKGRGENSNSIGTVLKKGDKSAFLAADITTNSGLESRCALDVGEVDLLKIGHHGYVGSSSASFLKALKPKIAVCTNYAGKMYPFPKWNLAVVAHVPVFATANRGGLIATFTDQGTIVLTQHIMD